MRPLPVLLAVLGFGSLLSGPEGAPTRPLPKDNSACLVCHANFEEEPLTVSHLKRGTPCAACHGVSYEHMDDEESSAKPDVLFGRGEVDASCRKCHKAHRRPARVSRFRSQWMGKRRPNGRLIRENAICTDCHGEHVRPRGGRRT